MVRVTPLPVDDKSTEEVTEATSETEKTHIESPQDREQAKPFTAWTSNEDDGTEKIDLPSEQEQNTTNEPTSKKSKSGTTLPKTTPTPSRRTQVERGPLKLIDVLPLVFVIAVLVGLGGGFSVYLLQKNNSDKSEAFFEEVVSSAEIVHPKASYLEDDPGTRCSEPPDPLCLVWDWNGVNVEPGSIVNYWCVTSTSFGVYVTVECSRNATWEVIMHNAIVCSCRVPWLAQYNIPPPFSLDKLGVCPMYAVGPCTNNCLPHRPDNGCPAQFMCCRKHLRTSRFCCYRNEQDRQSSTSTNSSNNETQ